MKLKIFSWNMARGRSMVDHPNATPHESRTCDARYQVLMELCISSDIGFIQEAGVDLHGTIRNNSDGPLPEGRGFWRASLRADFQIGDSPCRSALFCRVGNMRAVHLEQLSGGWDAERYPASAIATIGKRRVLLCSFHATSGINASDNVIDFLNYIDTYASRNAIDAVLVGGDFNCETFPGVDYPVGATHQGGRCIDGFYVHRPSGSSASRAAVQDVRVYRVPVVRELRTDRALRGNIGYYANAVANWAPTKVSDHGPVLAEVEID